MAVLALANMFLGASLALVAESLRAALVDLFLMVDMSERPPCQVDVSFFLSSLPPVRLAKNLSIIAVVWAGRDVQRCCCLLCRGLWPAVA